MDANSHELLKVVTLLGAAVISVPLFKKIGLGSVLGYLAAGLVIGPFGLGLFYNAEAILHVAELGVVMFLFVIGLEMQPSHLWNMRRDIFGLGTLQILTCGFFLTLLGLLFKIPLSVAFICAMGFALTSTAIVFQILAERGEVGMPQGQKIISILLCEDLLIVPLLAIVALLSPLQSDEAISLKTFLIPVLALIGLTISGLWLLNPLFRILSRAKAREVLTAAALLVVLGSALLMQMSGLSMAMGAFLAGVLLSESSFRHQIEADIEPFRGILLGLFFIGVGMSLNLDVVKENIVLILVGVILMKAIKAICVYAIARFTKTSNKEAIDRAVLMSQGGEFAFVLYAAAAQAKVISAEINANMTAIVVLSMALTPIVAIITKKLLPKSPIDTHDLETPNNEDANILVIGFGRFGQVACQLMLARDLKVTIIDLDAERIRNARNYGFKVYYGDGSRLDVLKSSGIEKATIIAVCIDDKKTASKIIELVKHEFPNLKILTRAYDRIHARELEFAEVDYHIRETFESAMRFGEEALRYADIGEDEIFTISDDIRRRDKERFQIEISDNNQEAAKGLLHSNLPTPAPLITPKKHK